MPMHDWNRVRAGTYHNFHYRWVAAIMDRLNDGLLPSGYFAMAEQIIGKPETDVVALETRHHGTTKKDSKAATAVAPMRPKTRYIMSIPPEAQRYARKTNVVAIHHELGEVVAVIEIVSPGNKDRRRSLRDFIEKSMDLLEQRVNLLVIDPFPPGRHDLQGIHGAIWSEFNDEPFGLPPDKPLTFVSYQVSPMLTSYVEPIAVGDALPEMPIFLEGDSGISLPLESTYLDTWKVLPAELRQLVEAPRSPSNGE